MANIAFVYRTQAIRFNGGDGDGFAGERDKLHFVSHTTLVNTDDCTDIASPQIFSGQVTPQHPAIMLFDFHLAN